MANKIKKVYILTLPRSGSTLLGQQLAVNSNIFHIGESMYWEMLKPEETQCSCGKVNCDFLNKVYREINEEHLAKPLLKVWQIMDWKYWPNKKVYPDSVIQVKNPNIKTGDLPYWLSKCTKSIDSIMDIYSMFTNKNVFVDNTKLFNIGEELSKHKDWFIIVLLRDPRGIMSSFKDAGIRKGDLRKAESVLPFCDDFISAVKRIKNNKNVYVVKYGDFCLSPEETLKGICVFLGENYEEDMSIPFNKNKKYLGHVLKGNRLLKAGVITDFILDEKWKNNLSVNELNFLYNNKDLIKKYLEFGYFIDKN